MRGLCFSYALENRSPNPYSRQPNLSSLRPWQHLIVVTPTEELPNIVACKRANPSLCPSVCLLVLPSVTVVHMLEEGPHLSVNITDLRPDDRRPEVTLEGGHLGQ